MTALLLASGSASRQRLLRDAAVPFDIVQSAIDEDSVKDGLDQAGLSARDMADALAELKALRPSRKNADALVLGCDQTLEQEDGRRVDKVSTREDATALLKALGGHSHKLHSAAVICEGGRPIWRQIETVTLHMRTLSDAFIDEYLARDWEECRWCVGCYRIEGPGAQLFSRISGSLFAVQGLPLLGVLDYLRTRSILTA